MKGYSCRSTGARKSLKSKLVVATLACRSAILAQSGHSTFYVHGLSIPDFKRVLRETRSKPKSTTILSGIALTVVAPFYAGNDEGDQRLPTKTARIHDSRLLPPTDLRSNHIVWSWLVNIHAQEK
jgi:hypothetical protein